MGKNVTIGTTNYEGIKKVQLKETGEETYFDFMDTTDANAAVGDILDGKSAYVNSVKIDGTMENRGAIDEDITAHDDEITILAGYHNGSGKVQIASADQAKLVTGNIKAGETILGVSGKSSVVDTDDADAGENDIAVGKTGYVDGVKITGNGVVGEGEFTIHLDFADVIDTTNGGSCPTEPNTNGMIPVIDEEDSECARHAGYFYFTLKEEE